MVSTQYSIYVYVIFKNQILFIGSYLFFVCLLFIYVYLCIAIFFSNTYMFVKNQPWQYTRKMKYISYNYYCIA